MSDFAKEVLLSAFLLLSGCCGGCGIGMRAAETYEQKKAVEAGVGRWVVDEKTGDKHFEYGPAK